MNARDMFGKLLKAYRVYYDVTEERAAPPFAAEAVFRSHEEQYFLIRSARLSESESNETVFFALEGTLTAQRLRELSDAAWETGTARVTPHKDHRNTDITLLILCERADPAALALVPRLKHYKSYRFGFQGWSHYRLAVVEADSAKLACNHQGRTLRKFLRRNLNLS